MRSTVVRAARRDHRRRPGAGRDRRSPGLAASRQLAPSPAAVGEEERSPRSRRGEGSALRPRPRSRWPAPRRRRDPAAPRRGVGQRDAGRATVPGRAPGAARSPPARRGPAEPVAVHGARPAPPSRRTPRPPPGSAPVSARPTAVADRLAADAEHDARAVRKRSGEAGRPRPAKAAGDTDAEARRRARRRRRRTGLGTPDVPPATERAPATDHADSHGRGHGPGTAGPGGGL